MTHDAFSDLHPGQAGEAVAALQAELLRAGFASGPADGRFGPVTQAAVKAFQQSRSLVADGVAGSRTRGALALVSACSHPTGIDLAVVRRMFPRTDAAPIERNLPHVLASLAAAGLGEPVPALAALATIRAEAECFEPVAELVSCYNTSGHAHDFDLYDRRLELGNNGPPDGADFRGRGYVQLTGRRNYATFGPAIGADLVATPSLACDPIVAAKLLAAFMGAEARAIEAALLGRRFAQARRLVNGGTHGLQRFTEAYCTGAAALGLPH